MDQNKETGEFVPSTKLVETTVGRALLSEILPKGLPFSNINKALKKKKSPSWINVSFRKCGLKETVVFADKLLQNGFRLATKRRYLHPASTTCWCRRKRPASSSAPRRR